MPYYHNTKQKKMKLKNFVVKMLTRMLLLTSLMLLSWKASSQKDTTLPAKDSVVVITKSIAQKVLKDLNNYDELKKEHSLLLQADSIQQKVIANKDSTIEVYKREVELYKRSVINYSNQRDIVVQQRNDAEKRYNRQKTKTTLSQILGLGLILSLIIIK